MVKNKLLRLVVDTNLWISFLISGRQRKLDAMIYGGGIRFLFSTELLEEISTTIAKPKLQKYFSANAMEEMLLSLEPFIELIAIKSKVTVCRDPKDNFLLALSKDGKADFLISGDKDLLEMEYFGKTRILAISRFLDEIQ